MKEVIFRNKHTGTPLGYFSYETPIGSLAEMLMIKNQIGYIAYKFKCSEEDIKCEVAPNNNKDGTSN